jgi:hypothetical protein
MQSRTSASRPKQLSAAPLLPQPGAEFVQAAAGPAREPYPKLSSESRLTPLDLQVQLPGYRRALSHSRTSILAHGAGKGVARPNPLESTWQVGRLARRRVKNPDRYRSAYGHGPIPMPPAPEQRSGVNLPRRECPLAGEAEANLMATGCLRARARGLPGIGCRGVMGKAEPTPTCGDQDKSDNPSP